MRELGKGELLKSILAAAEKHPNTRVSKLIKCVESERTRKNIVLLLIELAEHPEFASNISISLKYYLDMFEDLPEDPSFSEAGLLLLNSAIIYGKRVDSVHLSIEKLIMSLINTENVEKERDVTNSDTAPKGIRKGRKRPLEELCGPYEADMNTKRFKTLSCCKRFDDGVSNSLKKSHAFIESRSKDPEGSLSKEFNHPTIWKYSVIEDYGYDDEIDSKKNYKLFTYHLEHRYNTLIPDINFKMYFKMKDFIDSECREAIHSELWPPLSNAYIEHYVNLENRILHKHDHDEMNKCIAQERPLCNIEQMEIRVQGELPHMSNLIRELKILENSDPESITFSEHIDSKTCFSENIDLNRTSNQDQNVHQKDSTSIESGIDLESLPSLALNVESGIGSEVLHDNTPATSISIETSGTTPLLSAQFENVDIMNDSTIECNMPLEENTTELKLINDDSLPNETLCEVDHDPTLLDSKYENEDLTTIKVILPHLDDEGVFFSDLDERDQQMLSPAVVATDVFRCVKDKSNIIVIVDDVIKRIYNIQEPRQQVLSLPVFSCPENPSLPLNILGIHYKCFAKRRTFKLGPEFHILKKERHKKYSREGKHPNNPRTRVRLCEDVTGVPLSPPSSPNYEPDFYGFAEEVPNDKNRTLSRDSGISLQQIENTSDKEINDDFKDCKYILDPTLQSRGFEGMLESERTPDNPNIPQETENTLVEIVSNQLVELNERLDRHLDSENALFNAYVCEQIQTSSSNEFTVSKDNDLDEFSERNLGTTINENLPLIMSKVQEWHAHLQPILAQSRDRHHFDVFELGSEIMNHFDRCDISNKIISLNHVMENKDSSLISRYFLSTLLLANQGNVSININNKSSEIPSELNDVQLRLLSKKRNIVCLEDNIGLSNSQIFIEQPVEESKLTNIRTLKSVPTALQTEDRDSGIFMSDGCSV